MVVGINNIGQHFNLQFHSFFMQWNTCGTPGAVCLQNSNLAEQCDRHTLAGLAITRVLGFMFWCKFIVVLMRTSRHTVVSLHIALVRSFDIF